jgi:hypothetical protein
MRENWVGVDGAGCGFMITEPGQRYSLAGFRDHGGAPAGSLADRWTRPQLRNHGLASHISITSTLFMGRVL